MGSMYLASHLSRDIAFDWIKGTRILVIPASETISENAVIEYTRVSAAEPPPSLLSNTVTLNQPNITEELIYSGGIALSTLSNPSIAFDGSGPIPRNYTIYIKEDGSLLRSPDILQPTATLDNVGTAAVALTVAQFGPANLSIGLANATPGPNLSVVITLFGVDINNNAIQETITFGSSWQSVSVPGAENQNQFIVTQQVFGGLTSFQVISRANDGPNSQIIIYAEYQSEVTPALNNLAQAALVVWSGVGIGLPGQPSGVTDLRHVVRAIPDVPNRYLALSQALGTGGTNQTLLVSEDLARPEFQETTEGSQASTYATFSIYISNYSQIEATDYIELPNGNQLTPVFSPTIPNRALGQFLAATSNNATAADMVTTLNYSGFSSGVTAVVGANQNPAIGEVDCTSTTAGAAGNGIVTVSTVVTNPPPITISGNATGGYDTFGQIHLVRHWDYINGTIPPSGTYEVTYLQSRYQSRAIATDSMSNLTLVVYGVPQPYANNLQVRMRVQSSLPDYSTEWGVWQVITGNGNIYTLSSPANTKVQLELFGKCSGYSLYESN
jgi:hypothetical protein